MFPAAFWRLEPSGPTGCPGIPVKLDIARKTPAEQRAKASKRRGLKRPDLEVGFFFMMILFVRLDGMQGLPENRFYLRAGSVTNIESKRKIRMVVSACLGSVEKTSNIQRSTPKAFASRTPNAQFSEVDWPHRRAMLIIGPKAFGTISTSSRPPARRAYGSQTTARSTYKLL